MKLKKSIRLSLYISGTVLLLALLLIAGTWANGEARREVCQRVEVIIENADSSSFITPKVIERELNRLGIHPEGQRFANINTLEIENRLGQTDFLENAECVMVHPNTLQIHVAQIVPVMRVFDDGKSYYVNGSGKRYMANAFFHADVPVFSGKFTTQFPASKLLPLARYIENNSELRNFVSMVNVADSNNVYIVPAIYGHVVNIGHPDGLDNKFAKLKEFYTKVMPEKGWMFYDTISVKFSHQVVATRRKKAVKVDINWQELSDEASDDHETMTMNDTAKVNGNAPEQPAAKASAEKKSAETAAKKDDASVKKAAETTKSAAKNDAKQTSATTKTESSAKSKVQNAFGKKRN